MSGLVSTPQITTDLSQLVVPDMNAAIDRLTLAVSERPDEGANVAAMSNLAEGIQALVQHMRSEQQLIRDWVEAQAAREQELKSVLERLVPPDNRTP